jgi:hypothetical protein
MLATRLAKEVDYKSKMDTALSFYQIESHQPQKKAESGVKSHPQKLLNRLRRLNLLQF